MKLKISSFYRHRKNVLKYKGISGDRLVFDTYVRDLAGKWINGGECLHRKGFEFLLSPTLPPS